MSSSGSSDGDSVGEEDGGVGVDGIAKSDS